MYKRLRPWLLRLPPEAAHKMALMTIRLRGALWYPPRPPEWRLPVTALGLEFPHPLGLAAGFDKDGQALTGLAALGFGFLEVGTVTPRAQPGNPRPRLFRLPAEGALINRMGFNNQGLETLVNRLHGHRHTIPIGVNIGKNRDTPLARAVDDYRLAFAAVVPYADYIAVNLSSPNTPGLRTLQEPETAMALLGALKEDQRTLARSIGRRVPLAVKIAPDFSDEALDALIQVIRATECDAVIATNTTVTRPVAGLSATTKEQGGLSGAPLAPLTKRVISRLFAGLGGIPIIGVGGIRDAQSAWDHLVAGASLLQIYTGLIYEGPGLLETIIKGLYVHIQETGCDDLACALQAARRNLSSGIEPNTIKFQ